LRNLVQGNSAADAGGGIRISHVASVLTDNRVIGNVAVGHGGGMDLDNDSSVVTGGVVQGNQAGARGGGIHVDLWPWAGGKLEAIDIRDNVAHLGGGVCLHGNLQPVTMVGLVLTGNTSDRGGAVAIQSTTFSFDRALIAGNTARHEGGAISVEMGDGQVSRATVHGNAAPAGGAGLWIDSSSLAVSRSIFAGHATTAVVVAQGTAPSWSDNDTFPATFSGMAVPASGSSGNLSVDPQFVNATAGDFHLLATSPCPNMGFYAAP
jgi:predicted outer membrane repeat protein